MTDELALKLAARRLGRELAAEGVSVVPINGAHAISRFLRRLAAEEPRANLAGLYDEGEEEVIRAALERAGYCPNFDRTGLERIGFFACRADLEDELIRAAGEPSFQGSSSSRATRSHGIRSGSSPRGKVPGHDPRTDQ